VRARVIDRPSPGELVDIRGDPQQHPADPSDIHNNVAPRGKRDSARTELFTKANGFSVLLCSLTPKTPKQGGVTLRSASLRAMLRRQLGSLAAAHKRRA
jgi:hypothetical protein